jgi:hypothetical protein
MLIFQPPVKFCSDENIQTIFGTKLEDFLNYRIDYNSISQTVEKVVKKIFFSAPKASKSGDRQVLVEPTMALLRRPLDVLLLLNITTNVSGKCQKQNKLIKFNKCQETRAMLILKFKCLNVSVANTKKFLIPIIKTSALTSI